MFEIELFVCIKMDLALNNLQCYKIKPTDQGFFFGYCEKENKLSRLRSATQKRQCSLFDEVGGLRDVIANVLNCDIVASSNSSHAITITFRLTSLGNVWTPLISLARGWKAPPQFSFDRNHFFFFFHGVWTIALWTSWYHALYHNHFVRFIS